MNRGFTLIELLAVVALISILAVVAGASVNRYYLAYKYYDYAYSMESVIRFARLTAMERSTNVGICVESKSITITDLGRTRTTNPCGGTTVRRITIPGNEPFSFAGSGATLDPRGFAIAMGNACVSDGRKFYQVCVSRFGALRVKSGSGVCGTC